MSDEVGRCIALQSVPFFASGEQGQAQFCLARLRTFAQMQKVLPRRTAQNTPGKFYLN